jgi:hypothetical protein
MSRLRLDLTGQRFGRLTVVALDRVDRCTWWLCRCDCGKETVVRVSQLRDGKSFSCGCWRRVRAALLNLSHGHARAGSHSREYNSWAQMIKRCTNPKVAGFAKWGGRGIRVCDRWKTLANFLADMGARPKGTSLDRFPNNDGNYEPGNCRWATAKQQANNRRGSRKKTA